MRIGVGMQPSTIAANERSQDAAQETWIYRVDGRTATSHPEWDASPDVEKLDTDGTMIAYHEIYRGAPDDPMPYSTTYLRAHTSKWNTDMPLAGQRNAMIWYDLGLLPANAQIDSAKFCWYSGLTFDFTDQPGMGCFVAMNDAAELDDRAWIDSTKWATDLSRRNCSWNKADVGLGTDWSPSLDSRTKRWHRGMRSPHVQSIVINTPYSFDVTDLVRGVQSGHLVNAGFQMDGFSWQSKLWYMFLTARAESNSDKEPFLKIVLRRNGVAAERWNNKPFAFSFYTDDGRASNVDDFAPVFDAAGVPFSIGPVEKTVGEPGGYVSESDLQTLDAAGHDIGSHSQNHTVDWGVQNCADQDEMDFECDRSWVLDILGDDSTSPKSRWFTFPVHGFNVEAWKALAAAGFWGAIDSDYGSDPIPDAPGFGGSLGESSMLMRWTGKVNLFCCGNYHAMNWLVQNPPTISTKAEIKEKIREALYHSFWDGRFPLFFYTHGTKGEVYEPFGISVAELEDLLEVLQERGDVWIATASGILRVYRSTHKPCDPDAGDSYDEGVRAADEIWWEDI